MPETTNTYLVQISCEKALGVFDARLARVPSRDGTKLRRCQQIVTTLHLDLVEKLSGANRPTPVGAVVRVGGRAEESRYPNLRQLYGI